MKVLISNDDGVQAPGIKALYQALSNAGHDVTVFAPDSDRSGSSSAITITKPLQVHKQSNGFWAVTGTPADCVYMAVNGFFDHQFDLVVTGINNGANLGDDVVYSGTVGAAREGRIMNVPALAVSLVGEDVRGYTQAEEFMRAANWIAKFIEQGLPKVTARTILNINLPDQALKQNASLSAKITRMGMREAAKPIMRQRDPRNRELYWIGLAGEEGSCGKHPQIMTDFQAVAAGLVSITPVQMDVTCYDDVDSLSQCVS